MLRCNGLEILNPKHTARLGWAGRRDAESQAGRRAGRSPAQIGLGSDQAERGSEMAG